MNDNKNPENIVQSDQEKLSFYQRAMKTFFSIVFSGLISYFIVFAVCDALFNWKTITECIVEIFVFSFIFKFIYRNTVIYPHTIPDKNSTSPLNYSPGDINDPRNPFSYTTPGSRYYAFDSIDRDRFRDNRSVFSRIDDQYNR